MSSTYTSGWSPWTTSRDRRFRTFRVNGRARVYQWDNEGGAFTDPENNQVLTPREVEERTRTPRTPQITVAAPFNQQHPGYSIPSDSRGYEINRPGAIFPRNGPRSDNQFSQDRGSAFGSISSNNSQIAYNTGSSPPSNNSSIGDRFTLDSGIGPRSSNQVQFLQGYGDSRNSSDSRSSTNQGTIAEETAITAEQIARPIGQNQVAPRNHTSEQLNHRYRVRPSSFFRRGRVFAMLWHENEGRNPNLTTNGTVLSGVIESGQMYGQRIYSTIRRMVVIKERRGYALCVPILTYGGRGCLKPGLKRRHIRNHAAVYMHNCQLSREQEKNRQKVEQDEKRRGLQHKRICVQAASTDQKLDIMSRINFDKPYTVEHNIPVMDVGMIDPSSIPDIITYFQDAWDDEEDD